MFALANINNKIKEIKNPLQLKKHDTFWFKYHLFVSGDIESLMIDNAVLFDDKQCRMCGEIKPMFMFLSSELTLGSIRFYLKQYKGDINKIFYKECTDCHEIVLKNLRDKYNCAHNKARMKHLRVILPCENCGSTINIEKHHDDYNKPEDVRFLCIKCHRSWHKTNKPIYFFGTPISV